MGKDTDFKGQLTTSRPYTVTDWTSYTVFRSQVGRQDNLQGYDRFLSGGEMHASFTKRLIHGLVIPSKPLFLKVSDKAGNFVGELSIVYANERNETHYISWVGAPKFSGQGLMRDSVIAACTTLFDKYDAHRIVASIHPDNERSRKLAASVGFRHESTAIKASRSSAVPYVWLDVEYWAMLKEDLRGDGD